MCVCACRTPLWLFILSLALHTAQLVPFFVTHNAESEAIDLLMEVGKIDELVGHVDGRPGPARLAGRLGEAGERVDQGGEVRGDRQVTRSSWRSITATSSGVRSDTST